MGWKNVKDHYRIEHLVRVTDEGICIGSSYIHDIIVIGLDGTLTKREERTCNEDLRRYMAEFDADPQTLKRLVVTPNTFEKALTVFTYDGGEIIEKQCEEYGWPNVTHDGEMMFDNTFSKSRSKVVKWAKENAAAGVRLSEDRVARIKGELAEAESDLAKARDDVNQLASI
jgi:hypothetical protein